MGWLGRTSWQIMTQGWHDQGRSQDFSFFFGGGGTGRALKERELRRRGGGVPLPTGVWGGYCAPPPQNCLNFYIKTVSCRAFWVSFNDGNKLRALLWHLVVLTALKTTLISFGFMKNLHLMGKPN